MENLLAGQVPAAYEKLTQAAAAIGYNMACDIPTGTLLKTLAASKPAGYCLELGTGVGISTAWILDGLDPHSSLLTVEWEESFHSIAKTHLSEDDRLTFYTGDGAELVRLLQEGTFDFIFADTSPGKFFLLDETLRLLKRGGLYIVDDLLPHESWPEGHAVKVQHLLSLLEEREDIHLTRLNWSTGIIIATKK